MSAKKRRPVSAALDFARVPSLADVQVETIEDVKRLCESGNQTALLAKQRMSTFLRLLQQVEVLGGNASSITNKRGRPTDSKLTTAISEARFDIDEFDALRKFGWGNVPSDKVVIAKTAERHWPRQNRDNTLTVAMKRARKKRR